MQKLNFLTYYTEGQPNDTGEDLRSAEADFKNYIYEYVDNYFSFCPRTLIEKNPKFIEYCKDYSYLKNKESSIPYNESWLKNGLLMWKPHLIKLILENEQINYGDYLIYHDVNVHKYPQYLHGREEWRYILKQIFEYLNCDIFIPFECPMLYDVKEDLLKKYQIDREELGLWAGLVALKKSGSSLLFLEEWIKMTNLENHSPFLNEEKNHECFVWHSVDQAVVSILSKIWIKNKLLPEGWPRYRLRERVFCAEFIESLK